MSKCKSCGAELDGTEVFCQQCGTRVEPQMSAAEAQESGQETPSAQWETPETGYDRQQEAPSAVTQVPVYYQPGAQSSGAGGGYGAPQPDKRPDRVLGVGGFMLSIFLMSLPIAGFVLQIVWACGATNSLNRRNMARAYLIFTAILVVLYILLFVILAVAVAPHIEDFADQFSRWGYSYSYRF